MKPKPELKIVVSNAPPLPPPADAPPQQVEMPFAVVNGEPISQLPRDLYIPPQALEVFLEAFEGPLDLLLYLIRRHNLDILDIPLAEITRQYMQYIELMHDLQLELAGEYLVMAATLAEIKSRMLLPRPRSTRYRAWSATCGRPPQSSRSASCCARCRKSHCRKCWSHSRRSWCARRCSPTITFSASGCRWASV